MTEKRELILKYRNDVIHGRKITKSSASELFNLDNEFLLNLSDSANFITRHFQGSRVDIEELANIKKNFCSEDCVFCSQSAFFNTEINGYQLPPPEEIVQQA
jgi:biotin synthase